jgi:hypothetical protein
MEAPNTMTGAFHAVLMGAGAAIFALLIAQFIPSIIPARASSVKL